jgi:hypothetical protein
MGSARAPFLINFTPTQRAFSRLYESKHTFITHSMSAVQSCEIFNLLRACRTFNFFIFAGKEITDNAYYTFLAHTRIPDRIAPRASINGLEILIYLCHGLGDGFTGMLYCPRGTSIKVFIVSNIGD